MKQESTVYRMERKQAEEELSKHRDHFEELVAERTNELQNEISEHKRMDEELRTTREYLDTILLNMPAGLAIMEAIGGRRAGSSRP